MKFIIARIIGNELPPRDELDSKIKSLEHILAQDEPIDKLWVLNRIYDHNYLIRIRHILKDQVTYEIPFIRSDYNKCLSYEDKILYSININHARNYAFACGKSVADFVIVLDGDCYFSDEGINNTLQEINDDQKINKQQKHYCIPSVRINNRNGHIKGEGMVAFRNDADQLFNESIIFGNNDKNELIYRLNLKPLKQGFCYHVSYSDDAIETDLHLRLRLRKLSLERLINHLETKMI